MPRNPMQIIIVRRRHSGKNDLIHCTRYIPTPITFPPKKKSCPSSELPNMKDISEEKNPPRDVLDSLQENFPFLVHSANRKYRLSLWNLL